MTTTRQDTHDDPTHPLDVRAARAYARCAGRHDSERALAYALRMDVRRAVSHDDVLPEEVGATRTEVRAHRRAMAAARDALHTLLAYTGGRFACEHHDQPGACTDECLALAQAMRADAAPRRREDPTGCSYTEADYAPARDLPVALVDGAVVEVR